MTPLANFPVVRDLVVEMDGFMEKLKAVKPWIIVAKERAVEEGTYRQSPEELEYFKQFSMCINCMLCYSACPVVGNEPEFLGPAAIALGHRYNMDTRDEGQAERNEIFRGEGTVFACSYANECSEVCPKHVDPAAAVNQAKFNAVIDWATSFVVAAQEGSSHGARRPPPRDVAVAARAARAPRRRRRRRSWYAQPRYSHATLLFDATGIVYLLCGFGALRAVWMLGSGPDRLGGVPAGVRAARLIALHVVCSPR